MPSQQNEDATWDDMDWGQVDLDPVEEDRATELDAGVAPDSAPASRQDSPSQKADTPEPRPAAPTDITPEKSAQHRPEAAQASPAPEPQARVEPETPPVQQQQSAPAPTPQARVEPEVEASPVQQQPAPTPTPQARVEPEAEASPIQQQPEPAPAPQARAEPETPPVQQQRPEPPVAVESKNPTVEQRPAPIPQPRPTPEGDVPAATETGRVVALTSLATLTFSTAGADDVVVTVQDRSTVGRTKDNDVVIKDLYVSGRHAKFLSGENGALEILDLESSGGTFVNDEPVVQHSLANGDRLMFGTVSALFKYVAGHQLDAEMDFEGTLVQSKGAVAEKLAAVKAANRTGMLTILNGDQHGTSADITSETTVGRAPDNDVILTDEHVSNYHARLTCTHGLIFELKDLQSSCGTTVNGEPAEEVRLANGDIIHFGGVECVFRIMEVNADGSMKVARFDETPPAVQVEETKPETPSPQSGRPGDPGIPVPSPVVAPQRPPKT